jgi:hypothetical protein
VIAALVLTYTRWVLIDAAMTMDSGTKLERWALFAEIAGADAYFRQQVLTNLGYERFWTEGQIAFDEPFRSYVDTEFEEGAANK